MRDLSTMRIAAFGITLVAIVAFGVGYVTGKKYPKERAEVTVVLVQDGAGCRPSDPEQLRRAKHKSVTWQIRNTCSTAQWVKFDNFRQKNIDGNGGLGPTESILDPVAPQTREAVPARANNIDGTATVTATISKDADRELSYKYVISIGPNGADWPTRLDPDIDIWP
jgi:pectin methylesterase-like acyl-CoA thioesterase